MLAGAEQSKDDRPRGSISGQERCCAVTREVKAIQDLLRFVAGPDHSIVPDLKRKLPGRGVWVTATRDMVAQAVRRNAFARALKHEVRVPPELPALVDGLLQRAVIDALGIANKAGLVVAGHSRVEAALAQRRVVALLHASDAAPDGARKVNAAARRLAGPAYEGIAVVETLTAEQLNLALGRPNVVHAALLAGPASDGFLARCRSLDRYRMQPEPTRTVA